ncbi:MAG: ABC transporter ATP-binding protein [Gemmatimonadaceae bacterium]
MTDVALELASISKSFGRSVALRSASLSARRGTVHAILGENGAGKTTLMRIAFGMLQPDAGTIRVNGETRSFASPSAAIANGIAMVHQHFTLVSAMTVTENVALGGRGLFHPRQARSELLALAKRTGFAIDPDARVENLPAGAQQRVEILKALSHGPRVLILDEPTAILTPAEAEDLLNRARELVNDGGTAILITHKLRDALKFADDITVLRRGVTVWTGRAAETTEDALVSAMLGGERVPAESIRNETSHQSPVSDGEVVISLHDVSVRDALNVERLKAVSLEVRGGEIVGVAAVEGNGQHELLRILAGRIDATSGVVTLPPTVGFIPEDRQRDALIPDLSLRDNVALAGAGARRGVMDWIAIGDRTRSLIGTYDVRARDENVHASTLSGGNQQKLVVGREIEWAHVALVAENPSRGLDIRASAAVRGRIIEARDSGAAVVIYSSDLDEIVSLADRVVVVYAGNVCECGNDYESIGRAMLGVTAP